jgi:hypothetical protein
MARVTRKKAKAHRLTKLSQGAVAKGTTKLLKTPTSQFGNHLRGLKHGGPTNLRHIAK